MKHSIKRYLIGLIIPTVAAVLICGVFYYKNAHQEVISEIAAYEGDTSEMMKGIILRKDNWQDYFTLETTEEANCLRLKEEYHDKIAVERASFINITVKQENEPDVQHMTWTSSHEGVFEVIYEFENQEQVSEIKVEKVSGELYLKK